jgi:hypothetical protein
MKHDHLESDARLASLVLPLRISLGVAAFLAGLDKYLNLLADWPGYVAPLATKVLPVSASTLMHLVGPVEMAVGILILGPWTRWGAILASLWLVLIAGNLVAAGMFDIAVRDLVMAVGAWTLARLVAVRESARRPEPVRAREAVKGAVA